MTKYSTWFRERNWPRTLSGRCIVTKLASRYAAAPMHDPAQHASTFGSVYTGAHNGSLRMTLLLI
jgi:hypothetical protein